MNLEQIRGILDSHSSLFIRAFVYGSAARGESDGCSDVDLILVRDTKLEFFDRIREVFDLVFAIPRADILIYTPRELDRMLRGPGRFFLKKVIQEAVEIEGKQERGPALAATG
jgi:predicted nucleotidyltransferase